jgi:hypothetical protein
MFRRRRAKRPAPLLVAALAAVSWSCDDVLVAGALPEAGNVDALIGAAIVESDTGVVVNGLTVLGHPGNSRALWLDRTERFEGGGFPELDSPQSTRYSHSWRILLMHAHPPQQEGDTTVFRFYDHGDVAVEGVAMEKLTDAPVVGPGSRVRFDTFIRYHLPTQSYAEWMDGGSTVFAATPFHSDLAQGRELTIRTSGSDEALPVQAAFSARTFARLSGIENNGDIPLHGPVPVLDTRHPFVVAFDRPLDPERAFVALIPFPAQNGARTAFIQPRSASQRLVIPPHVLRQLVESAPTTRTAFRALVIEIMTSDHVFTGRFRAGHADQDTFSLPFVQRSETSMNLYLER